MYDDIETELIDYICSEGSIGGVMVGAYEGMYTYADKETVLRNDELFTFMMQEPQKWVDNGYLSKELQPVNPKNPSIFKFTPKVAEDRDILLRLLDKQNA